MSYSAAPTPVAQAMVGSLNLDWSGIYAEVINLVRRQGAAAYLVGGFVRDRLLNRSDKERYDLDFAVAGEASQMARMLADELGGAYFQLDRERDVGRAILYDAEGQPITVDFTRLRGRDLAEDLALRDFTINAIALDISGEGSAVVIDPLGGRADLAARVIRAASPEAISDDPVRALRAVRLAGELGFTIAPESEKLIRAAAPLISRVSGERLGAEFSKIVAGEDAAGQLQRLDALELLQFLLPELVALKRVEQSPPHYLDVYEHTLETVRALEALLEAILQPVTDDQGGFTATSGELYFARCVLCPFAGFLRDHLASPMAGERNRLLTTKLGALFHDAGKPLCRSVEPDGRSRFIGHEHVGGLIAEKALRRLRFSRSEIEEVRIAVVQHMRPLSLLMGPAVTSRAIYRFFRDTGITGIDILLLSLADRLATYGPALDSERWSQHLDLVAHLLETYEKQRERVVKPLPLLKGHDLMELFGLKAGPRLGQVLEALREAQAAGEVIDREGAVAYVAHLLDQDLG